jgi:exoribonuclease R
MVHAKSKRTARHKSSRNPRPASGDANTKRSPNKAGDVKKPAGRGRVFQKSTGEPSQKLKASILRQISQRPLDAAGLAAALDLPPAWKGRLLQLLKDMETAGEIARIRKDRYIIPKEADLFTGIIQMHANGGAHVLNETQGEPDLYIRAENCFTAMHGDRVVARI